MRRTALIVGFVVAGVVSWLSVRQYRGLGQAGLPAVAGKFGQAPQIFQKQCSACHGPEGFGDGKAAYLVNPRPRDFSQGKFLLVSTDNRVPTDEDLLRTISRGMPGSAMPPWAHLPEQDRRDLVRYVRALTHRGKVRRLIEQKMSPQKAEETATYVLEVGGPVDLPAPAAPSDDVIAHGKVVYKDYCAKCHGAEGRGDGSQKMEDDLGFRAYPRDFTKGIFKGGVELRDLATRILGGMPGSAMPNSEFKGRDDLWAVVHFVRSLVKPGAQERVVQQRQTIKARRAGQWPVNWDQVEPTYIALMPLWWRDDRVEGVEVRAAHDGQKLAIELAWKDPIDNREQAHVATFGDGAALQFSGDADPPFFGMGDAAGVVNIWMWKAAWENDLVTHADPYPRAMMSFDMAVKQLGPTAASQTPSKLDDRDPKFYGGWGAGNLISDPHRNGSVENLHAKGFGTLQSQGLAGQVARGKGVWKDGLWRVSFERPLAAAGKGDVEFRPGRSVRMGCAVWDGQAGDRNGQKSVTIWHDLALAE